MKFSFPPFKQKTKWQKFQKSFTKKWQLLEDHIASVFTIFGVLGKKAGTWLQKRGRAVARVSPPWLRRVGRIVWKPFRYIIGRISKLLARRPHRSFRITRRRDYKRSLKLPGYWSFTNSVRAMLWKNWRLFGGLVLAYAVIAFVVNGFGQQEAYQNLSDTLQAIGGEALDANWGKIAGSGLLLVAAVSQGLQPNPTSAQTVLGALTAFFAWLATVWSLRNVMAGRKVAMRDAIYSSGAPVIPTILVSFIIVVQILPLSLGILIYNAAIASGFITGVESMLAGAVVVLLGVLSIYWITSTIVALVVVTLPGMYPWRAVQTAGDLVVGRRLRILLRLLWMLLIVVVVWALILIPIILFDDWIKKVWETIAWVPIVPASILLMSAITVVFVASYIYMLYRKVVDDDAAPA